MEDAIKRLYRNYQSPAPRNRTLFLTEEDRRTYSHFYGLEDLKASKNLAELLDKIYNCDCIAGMRALPDNFVDLVFADPPYNLGKDYGNGQMRKSRDEYADWTHRWVSEADRLVKETGSIYVCSDWRYSGLLHSILESHFIVKNRITWRREKGRGSKRNWKNNMEDIWFCVKSERYTFNVEAVKIRKKVIAPYRENGQPKDWVEKDGERYRMTCPPNIWIDTVVPFWSMSENTPHPTQKPQLVLERILKASSNRGEILLDPFMGSGTTAVVARRLGRRFLGFELNEEYVRLSMKRLDRTQPSML